MTISTVVWQKFLSLASHTNDFNIFSAYNWLTALCTAISVINTFILVILCLRMKAMRFFLLTQRSPAMADYILTLPTTTSGPISPAFSAYDIWQQINTALSEIWGVEMILLLIFLTLVILTAMTAWKSRTKFESHQTKVCLDLCNNTLFLTYNCKIIIYVRLLPHRNQLKGFSI